MIFEIENLFKRIVCGLFLTKNLLLEVKQVQLKV